MTDTATAAAAQQGQRDMLDYLEHLLPRSVNVEDIRQQTLQREADLHLDALRVLMDQLTPEAAANVLGRVLGMMRMTLPPELAERVDATVTAAGRAAEGIEGTQPWTWDPSTGGPLPTQAPQDPDTPAGPEAATEAPIPATEVVPPAPGFGDDPDESKLGKVTDFLKAAGAAAQQLDRPRPAKAASKRARGRVRKAAAGG
jgi:hypothetical protein